MITIHKALDIEKKGMVGKADPYVVLQVKMRSKIRTEIEPKHGNVHTFLGNNISVTIITDNTQLSNPLKYSVLRFRIVVFYFSHDLCVLAVYQIQAWTS